MSRDYIGYVNYFFIGNLRLIYGLDPVSHRFIRAVFTGCWSLVIVRRVLINLWRPERALYNDLGSVSTGYSDRPVARAIKIKHAGLNLTGRVVQLVLDAMRGMR